jgi:hypothetical protein
VCLEVRARRLGSPLDSFVLLMNGRGEKVGQNDDVKDRSEGMLTHVADSELVCALPEDGTYTVAIYDTQGKGGPEYASRLRLSAPEPDFDLRTTPAAVSVPKGGSAPLFVHVIRKDGFAGEIKLALEDGAGLTLDGGGVPEGVDKVRLTITAAEKIAAARLTPTIRGTAVIGGKTVSRTALAAEDLMQAFIYQHLVPCKEQVVMITKGAAPFVVTPKLPESGQLELGYGKEVAFPVSVTRSKGFDAPIRLQLVDPPKGVVLKKGWIAAGKSSGQVSVALEANAEVKPRENLILSGIMSIEKAGTTTPIPAAKSAPATPAPKTPEKKAVEETTGGLTIGPRTTTPDSKAGKAPAPPPPPPKPADTKTGPPPERFTVTLPAIAIKVIGTPQPADPKAAAAPEKKP